MFLTTRLLFLFNLNRSLIKTERTVDSSKCATPNIQVEIGNYLYPQMAFQTVFQSNDCIKTDHVKPRTVLDEWINGGNHLPASKSRKAHNTIL